MKTKSIIALVIALVMLLCFTACTPKTPTGAETTEAVVSNGEAVAVSETMEQATGESEGLRILYCVISTDAEYFVSSYKVFKPYWESLGWTSELVGAEWSNEKQIAILENAYATHAYDVVFLYPGSPEAFKEVAKASTEAGLPIVASSMLKETGCATFYYESDNTEVGRMIAQNAIEWVDDHQAYFGQFDTIEWALLGDSQNSETNKRVTGMKEVMESDGRFTLVAEKDAGDADTGMSAAEAIFTANPNCKLLLAYCDQPGLGAVEAAKTLGIADENFAVFGCDGVDAAISAIKSGGYFRGTCYWDFDKQCADMADFFPKIVAGTMRQEDMPNLTCVKITAKNVADYFD